MGYFGLDPPLAVPELHHRDLLQEKSVMLNSQELFYAPVSILGFSCFSHILTALLPWGMLQAHAGSCAHMSTHVGAHGLGSSSWWCRSLNLRLRAGFGSSWHHQLFKNHRQQTLSFAPTVFSPRHSPLFVTFSHQACWDQGPVLVCNTARIWQCFPDEVQLTDFINMLLPSDTSHRAQL